MIINILAMLFPYSVLVLLSSNRNITVSNARSAHMISVTLTYDHPA